MMMIADDEQDAATLNELASLLADGGSGRSREDDWSVVYAAAMQPRARRTSEGQRALRDAVMHLLDGPQLRQAWAEVAALTRPPRTSTAVAEKAAMQLVTAYRWLANHFAHRSEAPVAAAEAMEFPLAAAEVVHRTACAFLDHVGGAGAAGGESLDGSDDRPALCAVLFALPTEFHAAVLEGMRRAPALAARGVVPALPAERALVLAVELLRRARGSSAALLADPADPLLGDADTDADSDAAARPAPLLLQLVGRAVAGCHALTVVDALLLQVRLLPAWKSCLEPCRHSHPDTPTPSPLLAAAGAPLASLEDTTDSICRR